MPISATSYQHLRYEYLPVETETPDAGRIPRGVTRIVVTSEQARRLTDMVREIMDRQMRERTLASYKYRERFDDVIFLCRF